MSTHWLDRWDAREERLEETRRVAYLRKHGTLRKHLVTWYRAGGIKGVIDGIERSCREKAPPFITKAEWTSKPDLKAILVAELETAFDERESFTSEDLDIWDSEMMR